MSPVDARGQRTDAPAGADYRAKHWWTQRRPKDEKERLQLASLQFVATVQFEGYLLLESRHPVLFARLPSETRQVVADYARRREARLRTDPDSTSFPVVDVDHVDRAAAIVQGPRPPYVPAVQAERRDAFRAAVLEGDWPAIVAAFRAWQSALAGAVEAWRPYVEAHQVLGLQGASVPIEKPLTFLDELGAAFTEADVSVRNGGPR